MASSEQWWVIDAMPVTGDRVVLHSSCLPSISSDRKTDLHHRCRGPCETISRVLPAMLCDECTSQRAYADENVARCDIIVDVQCPWHNGSSVLLLSAVLCLRLCACACLSVSVLLCMSQ